MAELTGLVMLRGSLSCGQECSCTFSASVAGGEEGGCCTPGYVGKLMGSSVVDWKARRNLLGLMKTKFPLLFGYKISKLSDSAILSWKYYSFVY